MKVLSNLEIEKAGQIIKKQEMKDGNHILNGFLALLR